MKDPFPQDLTLQDPTQLVILKHLEVTKRLLEKASSSASGSEQTAHIRALPDLGVPHNVRRIHGGFFTGAFYEWTSSVPFVPIDATVNVDGASVYRVDKEVGSQKEFDTLINAAIRRSQGNGSIYDWNFDVGNHFIIYGWVSGSHRLPDGYYLVLHSSASEYKNQSSGLYPSEANWYAHGIQTIWDVEPNRYLRYIEGELAERFFQLARMLEEHNRHRHRYFADTICGEPNVENIITSVFHYGMPSSTSIAIGCQWVKESNLTLLLTAPQRTLYFIRPHSGGANEALIDGQKRLLFPHGLGKRARGPLDLHYLNNSLMVNSRIYQLNESLEDDPTLQLRDVPEDTHSESSVPQLILDILNRTPGEIVGKLNPLFTYDRLSSTCGS